MIKGEKGFTMVELLVTMVVFVFVMVAASQIFSGLLTQFKQQSKIAETNIEGIVGLEILRQDVEHAGYGLAWNLPSGLTYTEAASSSICGANPSNYNDSPSGIPRAIVSGNDNCSNGSDYLVIKAVNVDTNETSSRWTELLHTSPCVAPYNNLNSNPPNVCKRTWSLSTENLSDSDNVIVISPGATSERSLKAASGAFSASQFGSINPSWLPTSPEDNIRIVYGLNSGNAPQRPFNRADYYISTSGVPQRCARDATRVGVLQKATMDPNGGFNQLPILDCVADFQVIYRRDTNSDGNIDDTTNDISVLTDQQIREQVKEVRVYILAHEGQMDSSYTYPTNTITIGEFGMGRNFDLTAITNWQNFRWKVYTMIIKPNNLR